MFHPVRQVAAPGAKYAVSDCIMSFCYIMGLLHEIRFYMRARSCLDYQEVIELVKQKDIRVLWGN